MLSGSKVGIEDEGRKPRSEHSERGQRANFRLTRHAQGLADLTMVVALTLDSRSHETRCVVRVQSER